MSFLITNLVANSVKVSAISVLCIQAIKKPNHTSCSRSRSFFFSLKSSEQEIAKMFAALILFHFIKVLTIEHLTVHREGTYICESPSG